MNLPKNINHCNFITTSPHKTYNFSKEKNGTLNRCFTIFIILLLILLIVLAYLYLRKHINHNKIYNRFNYEKKTLPQNQKLYEHMNTNTITQTFSPKYIAVLFKTHVWNDNMEEFVKKIKNEIMTSTSTLNHTNPSRIDFYILMHSDDLTLPKKIKDSDLNKYVLVFKESDIKKIYKQGFFSMWLSNHWILMWFFKQFKDKYQYYWSIEYDVRISGNSSKIWNYSGTEDFIYPFDPFKDPEWTWKNHYVSGSTEIIPNEPLTDDTKWYGYLQLARYSKKFLEYLDKHYNAGENGQDELITFSLFKRGCSEFGLTGSKNLLYDLIKNSWSVFNSDSDKHKKILEESDSKYQTNPNQLLISHPIKY
jgi:flagellar basal body-associated protein FliL